MDRKYLQNIRGYEPATHKVGTTCRVSLPKHWTLNANYRITGSTPGDSIDMPDVDGSSRLDLTVSKEFPKLHSEFLFGVQDLLNEGNNPAPGINSFGGNDTPGRTFFARYQIQF